MSLAIFCAVLLLLVWNISICATKSLRLLEDIAAMLRSEMADDELSHPIEGDPSRDH